MRRGAANPGKRRVQASRCDWIVVGAGIAGASLAYWLAPHGRVVILEQEAQPGYHATGRSAALYLPGYGPAQVRALTLASREFLSNPPAGFATAPILSPRGALTFGTPAQRDLLERHFDSVRALGIAATRLDARGVCERVPVLHERLVAGGIFESDAFDIDVGALLQGFLRGVRAHGGVIECGAAVRAIGREGADWWAGDGRRCWRAPVLVDAAGAWADAVAALVARDPALGASLGSAHAIAAEIVFAFEEEMATSLADCLMRRTMLGLEADLGAGVLDGALRVAAEQLGWDAARCMAERTGFLVETAALRRPLQR